MVSGVLNSETMRIVCSCVSLMNSFGIQIVSVSVSAYTTHDECVAY